MPKLSKMILFVVPLQHYLWSQICIVGLLQIVETRVMFVATFSIFHLLESVTIRDVVMPNFGKFPERGTFSK